ncbi:MAG: RNA methyltransferase [Myxococcota bacterium]
MRAPLARPSPDVVGSSESLPRPRPLRLHGHHAVLAVLERRPEAVERLFLTKERARGLGELLKRMARARRSYRVLPEDELQDLAKSPHHEGLVADVMDKPAADDSALFAHGRPVMALDRVENPNNLGAVCRSCAHFGAGLLTRGGPVRLQGAAARVAQGGAEVVAHRRVDAWGPVLRRARRSGYVCWALDGSSEKDLFAAAVPQRVLWIVGNEKEGVSEEGLKLSDAVFRLGGTGGVESLNASVAAGVALALHRRAWTRSID